MAPIEKGDTAEEPLAAAAPNAEGNEGLADALMQEVITPDEDVEFYMRKFLLPTITPALEALLHVAVERGELSLEKDEGGKKDGRTGSAEDKQRERGFQGSAGEEKKRKKKEKQPENQDDESAPAGSDAGDEAEGSRTEKFNPLLWFSEKLRESASGRQYKELFEKRMEERRRKREEEAAVAAQKAAEEAAAAEAAAAAAEEQAAEGGDQGEEKPAEA